MKSLIIGISRPGDPDGINLSPDTRYVFRCGSYPEITFSIQCKQLAVYDNFKELRYHDADPSSASAAISFFEKLMATVFKNLTYLDNYKSDKGPLHIRLITTPMELAQLPFEFVPSFWQSDEKEMTPLLTDPDRVITLTREVLLESEARYIWPKQPRILFAWAEPKNSVPHDEHREALIKALTPLAKPQKNNPEPEPDTGPFLTELPNASIRSIKETIKKAIENNKPYSHIHILAHGGNIQDFSGVAFRLVLCDDSDPSEEKKAEGNELTGAIVPDKNGPVPVVVTLSACDSANTGNVLISSGSLIDQLHRAGIPCVFASQFPLTKPGSIELVSTLYSNLVNAGDPREALHQARVKLKNNGNHDWASLVAYARFPEDINEQLQAIRLKMLFTSMKTTAAWVDHLLKFADKIAPEKKQSIFSQIEDRLDRSINELSEFLTADKESKLETAALRSEHLGLLGSAYKRKAEFLYRLIQLDAGKNEDYISRSVNALKTAKDFYYGGYDADDSNHWAAMQYLSTKAILGESLETEDRLWNFIEFNATRDEQKAEKAKKHVDKIWAWGTLAELYLLKPLTGSSKNYQDEINAATAKAKEYLNKMALMGNDNTSDPGIYNSEKESTVRQFERYIYWWPDMFSASYRKELKEMAINIRKELPPLDTLV